MFRWNHLIKMILCRVFLHDYKDILALGNNDLSNKYYRSMCVYVESTLEISFVKRIATLGNYAQNVWAKTHHDCDFVVRHQNYFRLRL